MTSTKDKHSLKVLAFLIACIIWGWIQLNEEEVTVRRVRVQYIKPSNLLETEELPESISVELRGSKGRIRQMKQTRLQMRLDIQDAHLGKNARTFQTNEILNLPEGVQVERFTPPVLDFELDTPALREIPVRANMVGIVNANYKIANITTSPDSVSIRGPAKSLNALEYISTKPINISNLDSTSNFSTQIALNNTTLSINQANIIDVVVDIREKNKVSVLSNLPTLSNRLNWQVKEATASIMLESGEDDVQFQQVTLLINVDDFITAIEKVAPIQTTDTLQLRFAEHPELFSLPVDFPYTIRSVEPSSFTIYQKEQSGTD